MLALLAVLVVQTPEAARVDSLLTVGYQWLARPIIGRYQALEAFRAAARLAPREPAPLYGQVEVGFYLGSDEGEVLAREALIRILAIDPDYRDSWQRFTRLFKNDAIARRADAALSRHPHHAHALQYRAELAVFLRQPARAESLAVLALQRRGGRVPAFLVRSEAAFLGGRDADGQAWHDSALAYASFDSTAMLWERASLIASPDEAARYTVTPKPERRSFFQRFWAQRDPNLFTAHNERLGEHARRLSEAQRQFRLLHPFRMVYRSRPARTLQWFEQRRWLIDLAANSADSARSVANAAQLDFLALQDVSATRASQAGLDARGLTFMRYGPPDERVPCALDARYAQDVPGCRSILDAEGWLYRTPAGLLSLGFVGAEYFQPTSVNQVRHAEFVLRTDASTVAAPVAVRAWTAFFRDAAGDGTAVYGKATADSVAMAFWAADGQELGKAVGRGLVGLTIPPGAFRVGFDVDSAGALGRLRDVLAVPDYRTGSLQISSLILAADSGALNRETTLAAMPADLAYATGTPLAAYAEVYGLAALGAEVRYVARYTFAPERSFFGRLAKGTDPVTFEFERRSPLDGAVIERLTLDPGSVPPGRYRVTLAVTDLATNVKSESVALVVMLR